MSCSDAFLACLLLSSFCVPRWGKFRARTLSRSCSTICTGEINHDLVLHQPKQSIVNVQSMAPNRRNQNKAYGKYIYHIFIWFISIQVTHMVNSNTVCEYVLKIMAQTSNVFKATLCHHQKFHSNISQYLLVFSSSVCVKSPGTLNHKRWTDSMKK